MIDESCYPSGLMMHSIITFHLEKNSPSVGDKKFYTVDHLKMV